MSLAGLPTALGIAIARSCKIHRAIEPLGDDESASSDVATDRAAAPPCRMPRSALARDRQTDRRPPRRNRPGRVRTRRGLDLLHHPGRATVKDVCPVSRSPGSRTRSATADRRSERKWPEGRPARRPEQLGLLRRPRHLGHEHAEDGAALVGPAVRIGPGSRPFGTGSSGSCRTSRSIISDGNLLPSLSPNRTRPSPARADTG